MAIRFGNAVSCAKSLMGVVLLILLYAGFGHSQADSGSPDGEPIAPAKTPATPPPPKRILGIVPNYRTSPTLEEYKPITTKEKFKIATEDSFDPGTAVLAALFGGEAGLTKSTPSFGQGAVRLHTIFRCVFRGFHHRKLYDRSDLPFGSPSRSAIFPAWRGLRLVENGIGCESNSLDENRYGPQAIQPLGNSR